MATTLAPPPVIPPGPKAPPKASAPKKPLDTRHWMEKLTRSGYFLGAVLLHLLIFLIVATWVVFQAPAPPPEDFNKTYVPAGAPPPPPPPQVEKTVTVPTHVSQTVTPIMNNNAMPSPFTIPLPNLNNATPLDNQLNKLQKMEMKMPDNLSKRLPAIKAMEMQNWGRSLSNIQDSGGDPHNVVATFPLFLASYADGDWGCNVVLNNGAITAGSLPDLIQKMNEWSHNSLKGTVVPTPLDIGSPDLMAKMPPFVFFTGHKDFVLTDDEVQNLRNYLQNGGAIWGDNSLPGYGSRFDVAFRREMKRVIPDVDKKFEDLPLTHDIFAKSWFTITEVPQGMNYYAEPLQHLDLDGKLAILYTPNDYGDLFFMRILPGDTSMEGWEPRPGSGSPLFTNFNFVLNSTVFFRNFTLPSCLAAHQLGMNIIGHLLVRFDKDLLLAP
jgi:hypothetical protein